MLLLYKMQQLLGIHSVSIPVDASGAGLPAGLILCIFYAHQLNIPRKLMHSVLPNLNPSRKDAFVELLQLHVSHVVSGQVPAQVVSTIELLES